MSTKDEMECNLDCYDFPDLYLKVWDAEQSKTDLEVRWNEHGWIWTHHTAVHAFVYQHHCQHWYSGWSTFTSFSSKEIKPLPSKEHISILNWVLCDNGSNLAQTLPACHCLVTGESWKYKLSYHELYIYNHIQWNLEIRAPRDTKYFEILLRDTAIITILFSI